VPSAERTGPSSNDQRPRLRAKPARTFPPRGQQSLVACSWRDLTRPDPRDEERRCPGDARPHVPTAPLQWLRAWGTAHCPSGRSLRFSLLVRTRTDGDAPSPTAIPERSRRGDSFRPVPGHIAAFRSNRVLRASHRVTRLRMRPSVPEGPPMRRPAQRPPP